MPKVVINDAKGVTQSRGAGLWHVSAGDKGFQRSVKSAAALSLAGSNGSIQTGINLPEDAIIERIALKVVSISVDDASNDMSSTLTAFSDGTTTYTLASAINMLTVTAGDILVYNLDTGSDANHDSADLYPTSLSSAAQLTVTEVGATYDSSADTLGTFDIIVEYIVPKF